jgi:DNA polymerase-1
MEGFEADDLIGTYARIAEKDGYSVVMVTGDKDFIQLVTDQAIIWDPMKDATIDRGFVKKTYGVVPQQMIDVMGLSGDTSDNVPGVPGIGQALALIQNYQSMAKLYEAVDSITKKKQRENLNNYRDQAFLSRDLVTIDTQAPVSGDLAIFEIGPPDNEQLSALFKTLEFRQLQQAVSGKSDLSKKDYRAVLEMDEFEKLIARLKSARLFAIDTS